MKLRAFYLSIFFCIMLSFCSFADHAYTGAYMDIQYDENGMPITTIVDVNPTGQTYSGQNEIKLNAINNTPVLTSNTFNGSTDIEPFGTNITSVDNTYNGTTDISYNGLLGGNLSSTNDSFQTTSVDAESADVEFNNPEFNGSVTLSAQNISVGSISQMDSLLSYQDAIKNTLINVKLEAESLVKLLSNFYISSDTSTFTCTYDGVSLTHDWISYLYAPFSFDESSETIVRPSSEQTRLYCSVPSFIFLKFDEFMSLYMSSFSAFRAWFYPLDNQIPMYWRYYNTDTQQSEEIGLAGLMYNISWYLGQLYALQVESGPLAQLADDVEDAADSMASMEQSEEAVINSVSSSITSFVPDISQIGSFTALAWCSNYLQQCWVSLGMYGTVIIIALMLGVCLQFIGYFRYK